VNTTKLLADALRENLPAIGHNVTQTNCAACTAVANLSAALAAYDAAQPDGEVGDVSVAGKRSAEGYLCYAWGETDLPVALFAADRSGVFRFLVCEWFGDPKDQELPAAMDRFDNHDFREEPLEWTFEIGGVRVERVYGYEALTATPPPASQPAKQGEGEISWRGYWLIERGSPAEWLCFNQHPYGYEEGPANITTTRDSNDAMQFAREVDARNFMKFVYPRNAPVAPGLEYRVENHADEIATHPAQATIKDGAAQAVEGEVGPLPPVGPDVCPFTGRKFWGNIEHPELGVVATYGGPFDTYTLPQRDADDPSYYVYRFDQDAGAWVDGVQDIGVAVVDDQLYTSEEDPAALTAEIARLREDADTSAALKLIVVERARQIAVKGWTAEHDDEHTNGALATAAACYASCGNARHAITPWWPWGPFTQREKIAGASL
jgi:hypothetical protein